MPWSLIGFKTNAVLEVIRPYLSPTPPGKLPKKRRAKTKNTPPLVCLLILVLLPFSHVLYAKNYDRTLQIPNCLDDNSKTLPVINQQVVQWKRSTPNQFSARARVAGIVKQIFRGKPSHTRFEIALNNTQDVLEVVYNNEFGKLPVIFPGKAVEACGVYITSNAATDRYQASPSGAIIHWTHINPRKRGQPDGYLVYDAGMYGDNYRGGFTHLLPLEELLNLAF